MARLYIQLRQHTFATYVFFFPRGFCPVFGETGGLRSQSTQNPLLYTLDRYGRVFEVPTVRVTVKDLLWCLQISWYSFLVYSSDFCTVLTAHFDNTCFLRYPVSLTLSGLISVIGDKHWFLCDFGRGGRYLGVD